jgi:hypothetical protein
MISSVRPLDEGDRYPTTPVLANGTHSVYYVRWCLIVSKGNL